jgi:hypothetical protein
MNRIAIAVVGLADGPEATAGTGILNCLSAHRFLRVGVIADATEAGAYQQRLLDKVALLPPPSSPTFVAAMLDCISTFDLKAIIPGSAAIAANLQIGAVEFAARGACLIQSGSAAYLDQLFSDVASHGALPMLARDAIQSPEEAGAHPACFSGLIQGEHGTRKKCFDTWQAIRACESIGDSAKSISAWDSCQVFEAVIVPDTHGKVLASATVRVLADDDNLRPWMAVSVQNDELDQLLQRISSQLCLDGPVQVLLQQVNSQFLIASVQPGLPIWIEITRAAGPDLLAIAIDSALQGESAIAFDRPQRVPAGILFSQSAEDLVLNDQHPLAAQLQSQNR